MKKADNPSHRRRPIGVTLNLVVCEYLDSIAQTEDRTRSQVINRIIAEHAKQHGISLITAVNEST